MKYTHVESVFLSILSLTEVWLLSFESILIELGYFLGVERLVGLACLFLDSFIEYTMNYVILTSLMSLLLLYLKP